MAEFTGFSPELPDFLAALKDNNDRSWFNAHKDDYQRLYLSPAKQFCEAVCAQLDTRTGETHYPKIFRIFRDIRFSKDKSPYNTHLHILIASDSGPAALFFGLEPGKLSIGSGLMKMDKSQLQRFRSAVSGPEGLSLDTHLGSLSDQGARISDPELVRIPNGYSGSEARNRHFRRKSLTVWFEDQDTSTACDDDCVPHFLARVQQFSPLRDWLNRAITPHST